MSWRRASPPSLRKLERYPVGTHGTTGDQSLIQGLCVLWYDTGYFGAL